MIRFEHEDFDPARAEYTVHHDPRSANDVYVAKLVGDGTFATLLAFKTGPGFVIGEHSIEARVEKMVQDAELTWGESGQTTTGLGSVPYRMFRVADQPLSCVGFGQSRGETGYANYRSDIVYGYFCQSDARPMSTETASDLIGSVSLTGRR